MIEELMGRRNRDLWGKDVKLEAPCGDLLRSQHCGSPLEYIPFKINSTCSMTFGYWLKYEIANIQLYLTYKNGNLFIKIFDHVSHSNINIILFNFVS